MQPLTDSVGVILAGGMSQRMGVPDKGEVLLGRVRLVDHVFRRFSAQVERVVVSGPSAYGLGVHNIPDEEGGPKGPVAGLYATLQWLRQNMPSAQGFFTVPVDGPYLPEDLAEKLGCSEKSQIVAAPDGLQPTFAYWRLIDLETVFRERPDNLSLKQLAQLCKAGQVFWSDQTPFLNLNTSEELQRAQSRFRDGRS